MKTITISSIKGGVGKTSLLILLARYFRAQGCRILLVDMDLQNSLTFHYLNDFNIVDDHNVARALHENDIRKHILPSICEGVDIVASHFLLSSIRTINPKGLSRILRPIAGDYDLCLIDSAPTYDNHVLSGWNAADLILTPSRYGLFDFKGLTFFREQMELELEDQLDKWRIVINQARNPKALSKEQMKYQELYKSTFPNVMELMIPQTTLVGQAIDYGISLSTAKSKERLHGAIVQLGSAIYEGNHVKEVRF